MAKRSRKTAALQPVDVEADPGSIGKEIADLRKMLRMSIGRVAYFEWEIEAISSAIRRIRRGRGAESVGRLLQHPFIYEFEYRLRGVQRTNGCASRTRTNRPTMECAPRER